jgi:hypothetical protein
MPKYLNKNIFINILICLIFILLVSFTVAGSAHGEPPTTDDDQYVTLGYNLQKYGVFSMETEDIPNPDPSAYREPGFPAILALSIALNPELRKMDRTELYSSGLKQLRLSQIPIVIIVAFLAMFIVYKLTKSFLFSYITLFLVGASETINVISNHLLSENVSALYILLISIFLYFIYKNKNIVYFIFLALSLGFLVLTKAIFMYFIIFILIFFIIIFIKDKNLNKKKFFAGISLFIVIYALIVGGWMFRNYKKLDDFCITNKGGIVSYYRSELNAMSNKEFLASFIYWAPGKEFKENLLSKIFEKEEYEKLIRTDENSYLQGARQKLDNLINSAIEEGYSQEEAVLIADKQMKNIALKRTLRNPFRHILVTIPIAWKGTIVETGFTFVVSKANWFLFQLKSALFTNIILFLSFFSIIIFSLKKHKWGMFLMLLPSIYLYFLNSFITHNKARYNYPLIPILVASVALSLFYLIQKYRNKKQIKGNRN